ncbi:SRPBCC family protein [Streptomyces platensis]|uniref:SRPBCC family protein n=1 Tax=Streptomyces platensis TaxID=58346 RepID=UPI001F20A554|nr:SRPBCC family protein [Streptomyces platensis]
MTGRVWNVEESLEIPAPPQAVYAALADVRRMAEWSPEVIWVWPRGDRFVGINRKACWVWFATCRIVTADPGREFAFDNTTFGLPIARWGYRLTPTSGAPWSPSTGATAAAMVGVAGSPSCWAWSSPAPRPSGAPPGTARGCA